MLTEVGCKKDTTDNKVSFNDFVKIMRSQVVDLKDWSIEYYGSIFFWSHNIILKNLNLIKILIILQIYLL